MSFRAPRPAGCRVLWLKAEPEAAGIPGSALHRSPGMAEAALARLELSPTRSTAGNAEPSSASVVQLRVLCCSTAPSWAAWSRCRWAAVGSLQQQPQCCVL